MLPRRDVSQPPASAQRADDDCEADFGALRVVAGQPVGSQRELATALGLSLGKTNFIVQALLARGWLKVQNFRRSDSKRGYLYFVTPAGLAEKSRLTRQFLERKEREYLELQRQIGELRAELRDELRTPEK
ncbi:MAG: MarR family EPS-associated transcriptional regulator [Pseudomonadota bacterium]|nr:MarR family EPS-associated transcriptional regulator [Pseudomonadota bacterium]